MAGGYIQCGDFVGSDKSGSAISGLLMPAMTARRFNPIIQRFADRLEKAGKAFGVVITACMRKLLSILNTMVKRNTQWNPRIAGQNG